MAGKLLVLGLVILLGGVVCLALGYSVQRKDGGLKAWPLVAGKVVSCSVVRTTVDRLHMPITRASTPPDPKYSHDPVWAIAVEYQYTAGGRQHSGYEATSAPLYEEIARDGGGPSERLQSLAAQLTPGAQHDIHCDPADPHRSYAIYIDDPGKAPLYRAGAICSTIGLLLVVGSRMLSGTP
jgi:hypothetical protein